MSGHFWLYWIVALPLTVLTISLWYIWQRGRRKREEKL